MKFIYIYKKILAYGTKFMLSVKQYKSALKMAGKMGAGKS